jgi:membrane protease YdiL (CAAX protease family)
MVFYGCFVRPPSHAGRFGRVFAGPQGVRTGWRVLLFFLLLGLLAAGMITVLVLWRRHFGDHKPLSITQLTPEFALANEIFLLLATLGATCVMAWLEGRRLTAYGLAGTAKIRFLCQGFLLGLVMLSLLMAVLLLAGYGDLSRGTLGAFGNLRYGAEWLLVALLIGLTEEFLFRGYLLQTLASGIGFWPAALLTSLLFGAGHGHNPGETYVGLVDVVFAGMLLSLGIYGTKSLWWSIGLHGAWDFSENFLYGTPDSGVRCFGTLLKFSPHGNVLFSGGLTGPEGSLFSLVVITLAGAASWLWLRRLL